jgi:hypothetical protein
LGLVEVQVDRRQRQDRDAEDEQNCCNAAKRQERRIYLARTHPHRDFVFQGSIRRSGENAMSWPLFGMTRSRRHAIRLAKLWRECDSLRSFTKPSPQLRLDTLGAPQRDARPTRRDDTRRLGVSK